jgi:trans-aconitate methyltransferase
MSEDRLARLKFEWEQRGRLFGTTKRSVLFKRFPSWLNSTIHRQQVRFIRSHMPSRVNRILDAGCGYGRISAEMRKLHPAVTLEGVELAGTFATAYERIFGTCFNGPLEAFKPAGTYDLIMLVTILMYIPEHERSDLIRRLWAALAPGGALVCIEPAAEFQRLWRKLTGGKDASPTGGDVEYFTRNALRAIFADLEGADTGFSRPICCARMFCPHNGIALRKRAG